MDLAANLERHPKFYIPSGDVVLALGKVVLSHGDNDEAPIKYELFRVHKFLLSLRSSVFANLFSDADAAGAAHNASYDGVSLVKLPADDPEDFALLLSCLYEQETSLTFRRRDPNTPIAVSGVVRLTDKYLIEPLQKRLVDRHNLSLNSRLAKWGLLDKHNLMRYLHGLREVDRDDPHIKMFMSDGCWPFDEESQASGTPCLLYVQRMINLVRQRRARRDPLRWLADCMEHDLFPVLSKKYFPEGLCAECRKFLYRAVPRERQRIWGELPKWFQLE